MIKVWDKTTGSEAVAPVLIQILTDIYGVSPWSLAQLLADWQLPQSTYWLVVEDEKLCGFLAVQALGDEIEVTQVAILPAYQGRGLATNLLTQALGLEKTIFLEVRASNLPAQALYHKLGFEHIGRRKAYYHEPVEDAFIFKRKGNDER